MVMERTAAAAALAEKLETRSARVGVLGLGYAGLPMAVALGETGYTVMGLDVDAERTRAVAAGLSPVTDVPSDSVRALVEQGKLDASTDMAQLAECDVALICVPTPLGPAKAPDLTYVRAAARSLAQYLHPGMLIILQSTVTPGTTRDPLGTTLADAGLEVGLDYFVAFCPERIDPGNNTWHVENTPKLVGGITPRCSELAQQFYTPVCDRIVRCSSPEVAEFSKLVENTYRFINISFVNEMSVLCDRLGVSVWEVIDAAATKPFAFQAHYPGPGVGGHCIPVVPFQLDALAREHGLVAELVEVAGRINSEQPRFVVNKLGRLLGTRGKALSRAKVLCLGVTYKSDVADLRESAALKVLEELRWQGVETRYWDPFFSTVRVGHETLQSVELNDEVLDWADAVVLLVPHTGPNYAHVAERVSLLLDTVNRLAPLGSPNVVAL
jgi:UDP-N-acetyl-D-glucosamine dehydrogenase